MKSKADVIRTLQAHGYFVILLFVDPASADLSILCVSTRKLQGGHGVPVDKLRTRFTPAQEAIRLVSAVAGLTVMFDHRSGLADTFTVTFRIVWHRSVNLNWPTSGGVRSGLVPARTAYL